MTRTQSAVLAGVVLVVVAIVVKMVFFPFVSDKYFVTNSSRLKLVPSGFIVIRPTHFQGSAYGPSRQNRVAYADVKRSERVVGINVTFQTLIALAYNQNPARVILPWNAPTNKNFDILVTAPDDLSLHLQSAIRRKLGYVAEKEDEDVPVLALKVENPGLQAFKVSPDTEKPNSVLKNGKRLFIHFRLASLTDGIEQLAGSPVVDETGLTNYYDFSLVITPQIQKMSQSGEQDKDTLTSILSSWGLGLEPDTASIEMLVVKKVY